MKQINDVHILWGIAGIVLGVAGMVAAVMFHTTYTPMWCLALWVCLVLVLLSTIFIWWMRSGNLKH